MIKVKHFDGLFTIWSADDVIRLRTEHRIVGNLTGALPEFPRQHSDCGLPLVLMQEEVRLLLHRSLVTVVQEPNDLSYLADEECHAFYRDLEAKQYDEINTRFKQTRQEEIDVNLDKIVQGKLKKAKLNLATLSVEELSTFRDKVRSELMHSIEDVPKDCNSLMTRFHIETAYPKVPQTEYQLPALVPHSLQSLKYAVFEEFWNKGYYLSDGIKFGAHFLAYDSDPIAFHGKFVIVCIADMACYDHFESTLLQAYGRLGKNVRKNVILAHYAQTDLSSASIEYKHIQWNPTGLA